MIDRSVPGRDPRIPYTSTTIIFTEWDSLRDLVKHIVSPSPAKDCFLKLYSTYT